MTRLGKHSFALVTFATLLLVPAMAVAQIQPLTVTDGPRIEDVSDHSAEIAWTTSSGGSSVIHYGTDPNNLNQTAQAPYAQSGSGSGQQGMHRVRLSNLQPNTTYYFVVESGQGQGTGAEVKSPIGQFRTNASGGGDKVPLYAAFNDRTGSHIFTTSYSDLKNATTSEGFRDIGVAGYLARKQTQGTVPLFHLFKQSTTDHFYTADPNDRARLISSAGYADQGIVGYIANSGQPGTLPLYRLGDPRTGQHFFTASATDRQQLVQQGWHDEGVAGYIWPY